MKKYCILYLVRHGETEWNKKGIIQGKSDIPLNSNGIKQAGNLAEKLKNLKFDKIYSSDLQRAGKTAEIIAANRDITIITDRAIRERDFGRFEGGHFSFLENAQIHSIHKDRFSKLKALGVETDESIQNRFISFLSKISKENYGKNVLIVSHGGIIRWFLIKIGFGEASELPVGSVENTSYVKLTSDGSSFEVKETFGIKKG